MRFAFLLAALFLASLNLRPAITSVSPLLGTIRDALGISNSVVSLLTSLPVLCMGLFAPAAVKLSLRFGIERTITLCLALIGVATVLRFWADTAWMMLLTAFLAGVGIAITGPLLSGFIKKHFTNPSAIVGIYSMALVVGAALGAGLAVPLQNSFGTWQASVSFWGILAVIALIFWLRLTRQDSPAMKAAAISAAAAPVAGKAASGSRLPLRNRRAWLLTSFFGAMALIFYSLTAWIAPIVQEMGYDKQTAGTILTLFTLIQIPVSFFIPILVSRFQHRMLWLVGCAALELIGLIMLQTSVTPWLTCIVLGIGAGGLFPMALMLPIDETSNAADASSLSAMNQSGGYIIGALGPFFVGIVHDSAGNFHSAIFGLMVVVVVMIIIQLRIGNKKAGHTRLVTASQK